MSRASDRAKASPTTKRAKAPRLPPRVAVVGMGHELRGDDAAGVVVARALQMALGDDERLLIIDAGSVPENHTGPLRRFAPDLVLFVDAAQMDEAPGTIRWLPWPETQRAGAATHGPSPHTLAKFLIGELGCEVTWVGIQPAGNEIAAPLSPEVAEAVDTVVLCLLRVLARDWVLAFSSS